jgi:polar amino acid transport system ATP-binding protein
MIRAEKIQLRYGPLDVLKGIDLAVKPGEVAAIIGPSGGGKSTFLRCLNGLDLFQSGRVRIGDLTLDPALRPNEREATLRSIRRRVGMVFQAFHLFPHRSAIENVAEGPIHVLGRDRDAAFVQARKLLDRVGLGEKLDSYPRQLSGGQQQRVAIARALAMEPEAILFDEPTSALDPKMTGEVLDVMTDLATAGLTMIVVTHAMSFARRVAHTVHVFAQGKVLESGSPDQIFESPKEEWTREFLAEIDEA